MIFEDTYIIKHDRKIERSENDKVKNPSLQHNATDHFRADRVDLID